MDAPGRHNINNDDQEKRSVNGKGGGGGVGVILTILPTQYRLVYKIWV